MENNKKTTYTYHFVGEDQEIEVSEYWKNILEDMDREEYNNDHRQFRDGRRCGIELGEMEEKLIADPFRFEDTADFHKDLQNAIVKLTPKQKEVAEALVICNGNIEEALKLNGMNRSTFRRHMTGMKKKIAENYYRVPSRDDGKTGIRIRTLRKENKLTIEEVSSCLGVTYRTYQRWEHGERTIPDKALSAIAELLGVREDDLIVMKNIF